METRKLGPSPITLKLTNSELSAKALHFAGGNHYLALKIMAIYGHDNMVNAVSSATEKDCRLFMMDAIKPQETSQLYQDSAIKDRPFSADQVKKGNKVAKDCRSQQHFVNSDGNVDGLAPGRPNSFETDGTGDAISIPAAIPQ